MLCGKPLVYFTEAKEMTCSICGKKYMSNACCEDGHFVCDSCHSKKGKAVIMHYCLNSDSKDPIFIAQEIMKNPMIHMHGPEHHVLVGAALITAYKNSGGEIADFKNALEIMELRGGSYPGGSCGLWGCCGAAVSAGMFTSIVLGATPLTTKSWSLSNLMTSRCLARIAELGGPRCCKRDSFTAIMEAIDFTAEHMGVQMEKPEDIVCGFFEHNKECKGVSCPFNPRYKGRTQVQA